MAFKDPPIALKSVTVFSRASFVIICEGRICCSTSFITVLPDSLAENLLMLVLDGIRLLPGSIIPRDSHRAPIVLAVPRNGQTPGPV